MHPTELVDASALVQFMREAVMDDDLPRQEGVRARKRKETFERIADVGLELFLAKGYAATTLDEIAVAAGISRRTFFHYFRSKDDILLAHMAGYVDALREQVARHSSAGAPFDIAGEALLTFVAGSEPSRAIAIARVMQESEALRARVSVSYQQFEQAVFEGLCTVYPNEERRDGLRLVAMVTIGVMRLAADAWFEDNGRRSLAEFIENAFVALRTEAYSAAEAGNFPN
jgi:AcrR family transcriptional regulator